MRRTGQQSSSCIMITTLIKKNDYEDYNYFITTIKRTLELLKGSGSLQSHLKELNLK